MSEPLPLHSPRWTELPHAYTGLGPRDGYPTYDIPSLLAKVASTPADIARENDSEPMFSLWSTLCHQGDIYPASYAAVPHLIRSAKELPSAVAGQLLMLAVSIALAQRNVHAPPIPKDLLPAFRLAIDIDLRAAALRLLDSPWDELTAQTCLAAIALSKGRFKLAGVLSDGQLCPCPRCGEAFALTDTVSGDDQDL